MANTASAEKRNRQAQKRRARNVQVRTGVKSAVKKAREADRQGRPRTPPAKRSTAAARRAREGGVEGRRPQATPRRAESRGSRRRSRRPPPRSSRGPARRANRPTCALALERAGRSSRAPRPRPGGARAPGAVPSRARPGGPAAGAPDAREVVGLAARRCVPTTRRCRHHEARPDLHSDAPGATIGRGRARRARAHPAVDLGQALRARGGAAARELIAQRRRHLGAERRAPSSGSRRA